jgi:DNA-binding CsgD family transcriptional regulator
MPIYPSVLDDAPEHGALDGATELTPDRDSRNMKRLIDLYAVTRAEARVALLMASGLSTQEVACKLDIGITTVRTHLNRLFGKTDTHHQAQLVALLLAGPPRLEVTFADTDGLTVDDPDILVGRHTRAA